MTKFNSNIFSNPDLKNSKFEKSEKIKHKSNTFLGISEDFNIDSEKVFDYMDRDELIEHLRNEVEEYKRKTEEKIENIIKLEKIIKKTKSYYIKTKKFIN
jgi:hypothetical protein